MLLAKRWPIWELRGASLSVAIELIQSAMSASQRVQHDLPWCVAAPTAPGGVVAGDADDEQQDVECGVDGHVNDGEVLC